MAVVDTGDVVKIGMLEEWVAIDAVHNRVKRHEGQERRYCQGDVCAGEKGFDVVAELVGLLGSWWRSREV